MKKLLFLFSALLVCQFASAQLYINEILVSPPGTDSPNEYIELRGAPNAVIPTNTFLIQIEGDGESGSNPGDVESNNAATNGALGPDGVSPAPQGGIIDLSGITLGSNGLLVIVRSNHPYTINPDSAILFDVTDGDLEDQSHTFLLINTGTNPAPTNDDDIDADNDGEIDAIYLANWTILDGISFADDDGVANNDEFVYADVIFAEEAFLTSTTILRRPSTSTVVYTPSQYDYAARIGNSTGSNVTNDIATSDWVGGDIPSNNPALQDWTISSTETNAYPNSFAGSQLNHIGSPNPSQNTLIVDEGFSLPYTNDFRTQENLDVAVSDGFSFDGAVVYGGTGGGGYTLMPNLSSIISPSIDFNGEEFVQLTFSLATFGGDSGQKLALKYSTDNGISYVTINSFDVVSAYTTFNQIIHVNGFDDLGKIKFEMVEGSNQIRFRDLSITVLGSVVPAIAPAFCGATVESVIYDYITLAHGYDGDSYEFTLAADGNETTVVKTEPTVRIGDFGLGNFSYGLTYNISVKVNYDEVLTDSSDACAVTLTSSPTTSLENQCGTMIASIGTKVYSYAVSLASSYRFSITNLATGDEQFVVNNKRFFTFSMLESFMFDTEYAVKAQVKIGNADYGDFGSPCTITSPESVISYLRDEYCGITLSSLPQNLYANTIVGAENYRFRITENGNSQEIVRPDARFSFAFAEDVLLNQAYQVEVAVFYNGTWSPYADICLITTPNALPTPSLRSQYCNATLSGLGSNFYSSIIFGATAYRFKTMINGEEVVVERPNSRCFMSAFAGAMMGATYDLQVAAFLNGVWGEYGSSCSLTVGELTNESAINSKEIVAFNIEVFPNPTVDSFTVQLSKVFENAQLRLFDTTGKLIKKLLLVNTNEIQFGHDLQPGVYILNVETSKGVQTIRLVKN
uniref:T9SS type A sorting domain-containing protein n=1 Tax=Flavobacterium sp. TaxID=239 RepID=UPI004049BAA9